MSDAVLANFADWAFLALADIWDWFWALPGFSRWPSGSRRLAVSVAAFGWSFLVGWVQTRVVRAVLTTKRRTETETTITTTITTRKKQLAPDWTQWHADIAIWISGASLLLGICAVGFSCEDRFAAVRLSAFLTLLALGTGMLGILGVYRSINRAVIYRHWGWSWPLTLMVLAGFFLVLVDSAASLADYQVPWSCGG